jgi:hypothetical protein
MSQARQRGLFEQFNSPSRLLSPFPTMTNIALAAMLGGSIPSGYETVYFDRSAGAMAGSVKKYLGRRTADKMPATYMDQLDYQEPLPFEFLIYLAPETVWRADMRRFRDQFRLAPQNRDYFGFLKGTDGLLHIRGADRIHVALHSLDQLLREIQTWCGAETELVLFSDHGMTIQPPQRVPVQSHLQRCGFELSRSLSPAHKSRVALPAFGLIGFAAFYCVPGAEDALADALVSLDGVDLALYREGDSVMVKSARGLARIDREAEGLLYRYELLEGDPLKLGETVKALREAGQMNDQGFASADVWTQRTAAHVYPDALANLYSSVQTTRVCNPADVLVSLRDGYYFGWSAFEYVVKLVATHGNARRISSTAFLMSTHRQLPDVVRASDAGTLMRG